jgi:UPF0755 protein
MTKKASSSSSLKKFVIALVILVVIALGGTLLFYYLKFFGPSVTDNEKYLYIRTGEDFNSVYKTIRDKNIVKDSANFLWAAQNMKYPGRVKPGRYRLKEGMTNRALINMLASGSQEPVTFAFHNFRLKEQFAAFASKQLEPDSISIIRLLDSADFVKQYGFTTDNVFVTVMPDSYQIYWNTTPEKLFKKMHARYEAFWTKERKDKAAELNLTQAQVSILASIVDAEALKDEEMPTIAGLYLNRLKKGMKLESDPTVIFAMKDFTIQRVLNRYLSVPSPYNTYANTGLPPGPIMMPSVNAVKAVLNYKPSNYIYMCAKEDFSGSHNFADNITDHNKNAAKFRQALNERNIKR